VIIQKVFQLYQQKPMQQFNMKSNITYFVLAYVQTYRKCTELYIFK